MLCRLEICCDFYISTIRSMCSMPIFIIIIIIISSCHAPFLLGNSYLDPTEIPSTNKRGEGSRPVQITGGPAVLNEARLCCIYFCLSR
jgi:hypothetical protein